MLIVGEAIKYSICCCIKSKCYSEKGLELHILTSLQMFHEHCVHMIKLYVTTLSRNTCSCHYYTKITKNDLESSPESTEELLHSRKTVPIKLKSSLFDVKFCNYGTLALYNNSKQYMITIPHRDCKTNQ